MQSNDKNLANASTAPLIRVEQREGKAIVSARELHACLEVQTVFTDWCKRMFEYGFSENKDYIILLKNEKNKISKSNPIDYALTLDCAKHIAMVQRTEKGKAVRDYFIKCEETLRQGVAFGLKTLQDYHQRFDAFTNRLYQLYDELENILAEGSAAINQFGETVGFCFDSLAYQDIHAAGLPTHTTVQDEYITVDSFFRTKDIVLANSQIALLTIQYRRVSKSLGIMIGSFGHQVPVFSIRVLQTVYAQYKKP